jgi:hypothetical protein
MANFMTRALFDDACMMKEYQIRLAELTFCLGGMINVHGYYFPKKGNNSVGVNRQ